MCEMKLALQILLYTPRYLLISYVSFTEKQRSIVHWQDDSTKACSFAFSLHAAFAEMTERTANHTKTIIYQSPLRFTHRNKI